MNNLIQSTTLARAESGLALSHLHVTHERNGAALWYQRIGFDARLIAYHVIGSGKSHDQVIDAARSHAHAIVADVDLTGDDRFARDLTFVQC